MHSIQFRQIVRDAEVANAISPVVRGHRLTEEETEGALLELRIPRAANVARIIFRQASSVPFPKKNDTIQLALNDSQLNLCYPAAA